MAMEGSTGEATKVGMFFNIPESTAKKIHIMSGAQAKTRKDFVVDLVEREWATSAFAGVDIEKFQREG